MLDWTKAEINALITGVYKGKITEYDIPEDLYFAIADALKKGLYKGFGGGLDDFTGKDLELLTELRENIYMFSAAKSYQEIKEISSFLIDDNGNVRGLSDFMKLGRSAFEQWNEVWGETEYNTAVGMAQNAVKWNQIEKEKDVLPVLRYSTAGSENVCEICVPLDGLTAPVDDPVWDSIMPENHFGCLCIVEQLEEGETTANKDQMVEDAEEKMNPIFIMNPGKDKVVFSDEHPYFDVEKKDRGFAADNFGLPIPDED